MREAAYLPRGCGTFERQLTSCHLKKLARRAQVEWGGIASSTMAAARTPDGNTSKQEKLLSLSRGTFDVNDMVSVSLSTRSRLRRCARVLSLSLALARRIFLPLSLEAFPLRGRDGRTTRTTRTARPSFLALRATPPFSRPATQSPQQRRAPPHRRGSPRCTPEPRSSPPRSPARGLRDARRAYSRAG